MTEKTSQSVGRRVVSIIVRLLARAALVTPAYWRAAAYLLCIIYGAIGTTTMFGSYVMFAVAALLPVAILEFILLIRDETNTKYIGELKNREQIHHKIIDDSRDHLVGVYNDYRRCTENGLAMTSYAKKQEARLKAVVQLVRHYDNIGAHMLEVDEVRRALNS